MEAERISRKRTVQTAAQKQIAALRQQLADTDYKIIKCGEYRFNGLELPYDVAALHTERQALRDRINEWEAEHAKQPGY